MYAVEQSYFDNGRVRVKVRKAVEGEVSRNESMIRCDLWIDIFETEGEALEFANEARNA